MSGNLINPMLQNVRDDMKILCEKIDDLTADMAEIKGRLGHHETQGSRASSRLDRIGGDVVRVRRRLELLEWADAG